MLRAMISTRTLAFWTLSRAGLGLVGLLWLSGCPRGASPPTEPALPTTAPAPTATAASSPTAASAPTAASPSVEPGHIDAVSAARLLASRKDTVLVDVRTPAEFSGGHIPGATNIDFVADSFATELAKLDRSKTYVVHCAAGGRSTQSLAVFSRLGFKNVIHLDGGLNGWIAAGQPVDK